jgi:hypothetical protein
MKTMCSGILLTLVSWAAATAQGQYYQTPADAGYSNAALGFHYLPPSEMLDVTESAEADIRKRAETTHSDNSLGMLLAMWSGSDQKAPGWRALTIETYPRKAFFDLDDAAAKAKLSAWVMGFSEAAALPKPVVLSGQSFTVSVFEKQERGMKKAAVVWTTIRRGKLVAFAFRANSPEQLKAIAESMKSLWFF